MSNPVQLDLFADSLEDKGRVLESLFVKLSADQRTRFDEALQVAWETSFHRRDRFVLKKLRDVSSQNDYENLRKSCSYQRFRGWLEVLIILSSDSTSLQQFCEHRESSWYKQDQMRRNLYYPAFLLFFSLVAFFSVSVVASKLFEFSKTLQVDASYGGTSTPDFDSIAVVSAIVPAVIGIALGAMILIRCLGGAVAWSFVGGSLPGIGGVWRWMATAELLRWTGLLGHAKSLPGCMEILACITEYPVNRAIAVRVKWGLEDGLDFGRAIAQTRWSPLWASAILTNTRDAAHLSTNCRVLARMLELQAVQRSKLIARVLPLLILGLLLVGVQFTYSTLAMNLIKLIRALAYGW